jgi:hypothetical protein
VAAYNRVFGAWSKEAAEGGHRKDVYKRIVSRIRNRCAVVCLEAWMDFVIAAKSKSTSAQTMRNNVLLRTQSWAMGKWILNVECTHTARLLRGERETPSPDGTARALAASLSSRARAASAHKCSELL